mgnify:CR=1 FL=1
MLKAKKISFKIPDIKEFRDALKDISVMEWLFVISCLRLLFGYFVPLNILYNAPHDDFLFYRLASSITAFEWLGDYDQLVLLKGAGFPIFLSLSNFFGIPIRVLESAFLSFASAYLITSPIFKNLTNISKIIIFIIIIFIPFQYTALDFRLLRDMIYPWLLFIVMGSAARLLFSDDRSNKSLILQSIALGLTLGFFDITREEGIWIIPSVIFLGLLLFFVTKQVPTKNVLISTGFVFVSFASVVSFISLANFIKYDSPIRTEFRNGGFSEGYGKLYRFRSNTDVRRGSLSSEDWARLFDVIESAAPLKDYVMGPSYQGWVGTSCSAIRSQHPWESNPNCDDVMLNGYLMMALKDGIYGAGFKSPKLQSYLMTNIGNEIDLYCAQNEKKCFPKAIAMMPPETFSLRAVKATLANLPRAFGVMLDSNNANVSGWSGSGSFSQQHEIARYFSSYILYDILPRKGVVPNLEEQSIFNTSGISSAGIIESVNVHEGVLNVYGWVLPRFKNPDIFIRANGFMCKTHPENMRPDVSDVEHPLGFFCSITLSENIENGVELVGKVVSDGGVYFVDQTKDVEVLLKKIGTGFDEECYLSENSDVAEAVKAGEFQSGFEHYSMYGYKENRKCGGPTYLPISLSEQYPQWIKKFENSLMLKSIEKLGTFYQAFLDIGLFFIAAAFFVCFFHRKHLISGFLSICMCLVATRLALISLLDFNGLAPITALYLYSGTIMYTLASAVGLMLFIEFAVVIYQKKYRL